jgi:hypothetical protein
VLEIAFRRSKVETGANIFDKYSPIMAYADVIIMGKRLQDVKEVFTPLVEQTNRMGLKGNEKKVDSITKAL